VGQAEGFDASVDVSGKEVFSSTVVLNSGTQPAGRVDSLTSWVVMQDVERVSRGEECDDT
jgi:hypothetical protein